MFAQQGRLQVNLHAAACGIVVCCIAGCAWMLGGCDDSAALTAGGSRDVTSRPGVQQELPDDVRPLLPVSSHIHPFTGTRTFDKAGGVKGLEVRLEVLDAYEDQIKAYGDFRFELYRLKPNSLDKRGELVDNWPVSLRDPDANSLHWDRITRTYVFKLQWYKPIPVGQQYVLDAVFSSPYTVRLFDQRVFVSGQ